MTAGALVDALLSVAAMPVLVAAAYLAVLAALSRRRAPPPYPAPHLRFDVVIPAHDEEAGIAETVASCLAVDYPPELRRVVVVADNCTDATAARAREAGARVLVRDDPRHRGKGYALAHAFAWGLSDGFADAFIVIDADTLVSPELLRAFAARLEAGAMAVQGRYAVRNPDASWRTRLMTIAFALFHDVRSLGRERLSLSAGLRGNGMCFAAALLRDVPHDAFSIVEDLEYGIRLGLAGHRVHYADEAIVRGEMVSTEEASRSQRRRWEGGRAQIARTVSGTLARAAIARRDRVLADLLVDLLVPPLSVLGMVAGAGLVASLAARWETGAALVSPFAWGSAVALLAAHVLRGWWISGTGVAGALALICAPFFVAWKVRLALAQRPDAPVAWVRTRRERDRSARAAGE